METEYTKSVRKVRNALHFEGGFDMELAKVTSKGQVTIPVEIRRKLGIKNGDKVLFMEEGGRIYMMNSSMDAFRDRSSVWLAIAAMASVRALICSISFAFSIAMSDSLLTLA